MRYGSESASRRPGIHFDKGDGCPNDRRDLEPYRRTSLPRYQPADLGIVLAVVTFWLFAQTTLNVAPTMRADLHITNSESNIAVSITALFSGIFIVVAGGLADQFGRVKLTYIGLALSILGSLLIALSPPGTAMFLMAGRIIQAFPRPALCRRRWR